MEDKKKEIFFPILVVVCTAVVFFFIGYSASTIFGTTHTMTTQIEYVEPSSTVTTTSSTVSSVSDDSVSSDSTKLDLNSVTKEQLMAIPGIGEAYAQRILEYRDLVGAFTSVEQLQEIEGIGEKRYAQWAPYFTVS